MRRRIEQIGYFVMGGITHCIRVPSNKDEDNIGDDESSLLLFSLAISCIKW